MNETLRALLKLARQQSGLKQSEVAARMPKQVTNGTISNWENGVSKPEIDEFVQFCKICGADYAAMLARAYDEPAEPTIQIEYTAGEVEMIRKFRCLDKRAQRVIMRNLDAEYAGAERK